MGLSRFSSPGTLRTESFEKDCYWRVIDCVPRTGAGTLTTFEILQGCAAEQQGAIGATDNGELRHTRDTTIVGRCDGATYYGVQECFHRGFILGRAPELQREPHRAAIC